MLLYADDTAIFFSHKDPNVISSTLSSAMHSCHDWLTDNKLSLHLGKTESILFGPKRKIQCFDIANFSIWCNGLKIEAKSSVKYLGIIIDNFLSGEQIVNSIVKKVNQRLKFLYRNRSCLSLPSRKTLCSALIQCHFDYACTSWYEGLSNKLKQQLQVVQNRMVRFILDLHPRSSVSFKEFEKLGYLKVNDRVCQIRLNHVSNISNGNCPGYLNTHFKRKTSYATRASHLDYTIPKIRGVENTTFFIMP